MFNRIFCKMRKKGLIYMPLIAVITLVTMISIYLVIGSKSGQFAKEPIGEKQFDFIGSVGHAENVGLYIDEAARRISYQTWYELAKKGGYAGISGCGEFEGYAIWTAAGQECYPASINREFSAKFNSLFDSQTGKYTEAYIPSNNFIVNLEKQDTRSVVTGISKELVYINVGAEPFVPLNVMPGDAKIQKVMDNVMGSSDMIANTAKSHGVDRSLLFGVVAGTSEGNPDHVSKYGCVGLAGLCYPAAQLYTGERQITDCEGYGVNCMRSDCPIEPSDFRRDPEESIEYLAVFIKKMKEKFSKYTKDESFLDRLAVASLFIDPDKLVQELQYTPATEREFEKALSEINILQMEEGYEATKENLDRCGEKFREIRKTIYRIIGYQKEFADRHYLELVDQGLSGEDADDETQIVDHKPNELSFYSLNPSFRFRFPYSEEDYRYLRTTAREFYSKVVECSKKKKIPECAEDVFSEMDLETQGWEMDEYTPDEELFYGIIEDLQICMNSPEDECSCKIELDTTVADQYITIRENSLGDIQFNYLKDTMNIEETIDGEGVSMLYHLDGRNINLEDDHLEYHIDPEILPSFINRNDIELRVGGKLIDNSNEARNKAAMYVGKMKIGSDIFLGFFSKDDFQDYLAVKQGFEPCTMEESKYHEYTFKFQVEDEMRGAQWVYDEELGKQVAQNIVHKFAISFYDQEAPPPVESLSAEDLLGAERAILLNIGAVTNEDGSPVEDISHYNLYCQERTGAEVLFADNDVSDLEPDKSVWGFDREAENIHAALRKCGGEWIEDSTDTEEHEYHVAVTAVDYSGNEDFTIKKTASAKSVDDLAPPMLFPYRDLTTSGAFARMKYKSENIGDDLVPEYVLKTDIRLSDLYSKTPFAGAILKKIEGSELAGGGYLTMPLVNSDGQTVCRDLERIEVLLKRSSGGPVFDKNQYSSFEYEIDWDAVNYRTDSALTFEEQHGILQTGAYDYDVVVSGIDERGNVVIDLSKIFVDEYLDDEGPKIDVIDRFMDDVDEEEN
jgi:hypothetical protein